jgi:thiosulfate/3-mercaptopyruvate sulfurtransferase
MARFSLPSVVTTAWLEDHLEDPRLVILDTSWYLPGSGREALDEFREGHPPGARFFDLDQASDPDSPLPHMMPSPEAFARYVGSLGIGNDSVVVVYDGSGANMSAARVWWMFRAFGHDAVTLLDGGVAKWKAEGRRLEGGAAPQAHRVFRARQPSGRIRTLEEVAAALRTGAAQVVDARSRERFEGSAPEPRPGLASGHMPGAVNLPYADLVHADGTVLGEVELREQLRAAGVRLDRPVVSTCGSGTSACALLLVLHRLGLDDAWLYDGSWTEWAGRGMPIVRGPAGPRPG